MAHFRCECSILGTEGSLERKTPWAGRRAARRPWAAAQGPAAARTASAEAHHRKERCRNQNFPELRAVVLRSDFADTG